MPWILFPALALSLFFTLMAAVSATKLAYLGVPCPHCKQEIRRAVTATYTEIPAVNNEAIDTPTEMTVSQ